jgi:hypothetical protein
MLGLTHARLKLAELKMGFETNVSIELAALCCARPPRLANLGLSLGPAFQRSFPDGMDQIDRRVQDPARDNEQNEPYQIVDLLSEFGRGLLHRLRTPKDSFQKYDDRDCRNQDGDELIHVDSLHP